MPSMGDRCRSGEAGMPVPFRGVIIAPPPCPPTQRRSGYAEGGSVSAEGERTLMGPAAQLPVRAPKAPDPHAVRVLKRPNERKLAGWANDSAGHAPGAFVTAGRCG